MKRRALPYPPPAAAEGAIRLAPCALRIARRRKERRQAAIAICSDVTTRTHALLSPFVPQSSGNVCAYPCKGWWVRVKEEGVKEDEGAFRPARADIRAGQKASQQTCSGAVATKKTEITVGLHLWCGFVWDCANRGTPHHMRLCSPRLTWGFRFRFRTWLAG